MTSAPRVPTACRSATCRPRATPARAKPAPRGRTAAIADTHLKAAARPVDRSRRNVALVTHGGMIAKAFGAAISEGGILTLERRADGRCVALGHTTGSDPGFPARAKLMDREPR